MEETIKVLEEYKERVDELLKDNRKLMANDFPMNLPIEYNEVEKAIFDLLQAYKEDERVIEEMSKHIFVHNLSCPNDLHEFECKAVKRFENCKNEYELCWKDYFRNKVREENKE